MIAETALLIIATCLLARADELHLARAPHYAAVIAGWAILLAIAVFQTT